MGYLNHLKLLEVKNKVSFFNYKNNSFFYALYRKIAIFISPLILFLNPNLISSLSLLAGFLGLMSSIFMDIKLNFVMYFFFISFVLDFSDGIVARYKKASSFHGRFIDGLFDILVLGFIHIIVINHILNSSGGFFEKNFYYLVVLLLPIQHLILDRFSAIARWCNKINNNNKIKPYLRNNYLRKPTFLFFDLQQICLILLLAPKYFDQNLIIEIYLIISFVASLITIILYTYLSKKFFSSTSNFKHNK